MLALLLLALLSRATDAHPPLLESTKIDVRSDDRTSTRHAETSHITGCHPLPTAVSEAANLTDTELHKLASVCLDGGSSTVQEPEAKVTQENVVNKRFRGIPEGVECTHVEWCDDSGVCSTVCQRGSVVIDPWLKNAMKTQIIQSRQLPFCFAQLLGSHNSGITLADGYGNRDKYYEHLLRTHLLWNAVVETNNQLFTLTDQLNMGARLLEIDVHWFEGALRLGHCGGWHSVGLDMFIKLLNAIARLFGQPVITWDSETFGCKPSLSSIPVRDQRFFVDALKEVAAWLKKPENQGEFVILVLDEQKDLQRWGKLDDLVRDIAKAFSQDKIFSPVDRIAMFSGRSWPSIGDALSLGKNVMFVSRQDFTSEVHQIVFRSRDETLCGWSEPDIDDFRGDGMCPGECVDRNKEGDCVPSMEGQTFRVATCELLYGFLNCHFELTKSNGMLLNADTLPSMMSCGINFPSPDRLTPLKAAASVWSWAMDHPPIHSPSESLCTVISAEDGRWRAGDCADIQMRNGTIVDVPIACKENVGVVNWGWGLGFNGTCPEGFTPGVPRHGKENKNLQNVLLEHNVGVAMLVGDVPGLDRFPETVVAPPPKQ